MKKRVILFLAAPLFFSFFQRAVFARGGVEKIAEASNVETAALQPLSSDRSGEPTPISLDLPAPEALGPAQVILIRHAEKPETGPDLSDRGRERAQALVDFFKTNPAVTRHGVPAAIYAGAPVSEGKSLRPIETVTPLSQSLGIKINENFTRETGAQMANDVMHNPDCAGKTALICWNHGNLPDLLKNFGWDSGPGKWPGGDVFDRVWILNFENGKPVSFEDIPQHLLPGDSAN